LRHVRHQHGHQVGVPHRVGGLGDRESVALGIFPARATLAHADSDFEAAVLEVERMRPALAAVAEHRDVGALQCFLVDVLLRIKMHREITPVVKQKTPQRWPVRGLGMLK
jgi:hypothetical protein